MSRVNKNNDEKYGTSRAEMSWVSKNNDHRIEGCDVPGEYA